MCEHDRWAEAATRRLVEDEPWGHGFTTPGEGHAVYRDTDGNIVYEEDLSPPEEETSD